MTEENSKMVKTLKDYGEAFSNDKVLEFFIAPDIPDAIMKKLVKNYDENLPVNSVLAYYPGDKGNSCNSGFIITNDGFYCKSKKKTLYIHYIDIDSVRCLDDATVSIKTIGSNAIDLEIKVENNSPQFAYVVESLKSIDRQYGQSTHMSSGEVEKVKIPKDKMIKCNVIIHAASVACGGIGTGLAQIPTSDALIITPIQISMIMGLGKVFDIKLTEAGAKSIFGTLSASFVGRAASQLLVGWIPIAGNILNTATAAGITEALGWLAAKDFYNRWNDNCLKGKKEGFKEASEEYERVLHRQAEEFMSQKKSWEKEREEYESLLKEYEEYIRNLEETVDDYERIVKNKKIYNDLSNITKLIEG